MASLNKCSFIGNLGKDPEVKEVGSSKVANFSIAVTEKFKNREGQYQEKTEWINIVIWGKLADVVEKYLKKGSSIYIEGKLQTRSWDDQEGNKKYITEILGNNFQMLGGRSSEGSSQAPKKDNYNQKEEDELPF